MRGAAMMVAALVGPLAAGALPQCHMGVVRTPARAESTLSVARAFSWRVLTPCSPAGPVFHLR